MYPPLLPGPLRTLTSGGRAEVRSTQVSGESEQIEVYPPFVTGAVTDADVGWTGRRKVDASIGRDGATRNGVNRISGLSGAVADAAVWWTGRSTVDTWGRGSKELPKVDERKGMSEELKFMGKSERADSPIQASELLTLLERPYSRAVATSSATRIVCENGRGGWDIAKKPA